MKILSSKDIRALDRLAISEEGISTYELMERASVNFTTKFISDFPSTDIPISIFCGSGNNGGDGLAIARLLRNKLYDVKVYLCQLSPQLSPDASVNYGKLQAISEIELITINKGDEFPETSQKSIIIDAILGSGTDRPLNGYWEQLVAYLSGHSGVIVAVDQATGLLMDTNVPFPAMRVDYTYSFQLPKLAFFISDYHKYVGEWSIVDIGIADSLINTFESDKYLITKALIQSIYKKRLKHAHKGNFGHALLISGSYGLMGASVLASHACVRSGAGKVTTYSPKCGYGILQTCVPECMVTVDKNEDHISEIMIEPDSYEAIGIGPGIGRTLDTQEAFFNFLESYYKPLILDADALFALSQNPESINDIPVNSVLTPHVGEFDRLFGPSRNAYDRYLKQVELAKRYQLVIVLKGAHTSIVNVDGTTYFNNTGNPGMATGGSGDVLTGIIVGLMAQGYSSINASLLGVYLHGLSGDLALAEESQESLIASDVNRFLGRAFKTLRS